MKKIKLFITLLFLCIGYSYAQTNIDSLLLEYAEVQNDTLRTYLCDEIASYYYNSAEDLLAVEYARETQELADELGLLEERVSSRIILGTIFTLWGISDKALEQLKEAIEYNKELKDDNLMSMALSALSFLFEELGEYEISIAYIKDALKYDIKLEHWDNVTISYSNVSTTYLQINTDSAYYYLKKAYDLTAKHHLDRIQPTILNNMGVYYMHMGIYHEALLYFKKARAHPYIFEDITTTTELFANMAKTYIELDSFKRAEQYIHELNLLPDSNLYIEKQRLYYECLFKLDSIQGNYQEALKSQQQLSRLNKQSSSNDFRMKMANFESVYETNKKSAQIQLLKEQQEIKESKIALQRWLIFALLFIAVLIAVLLFFMNISNRKNYRLNRRLRRANLELHDVNINKDKFISILSHDLKGPFHAVLGLTQSFKDNYDHLEEGERKEIANYINEASQKIYTLLEDLLEWSRSQKHQIKPSYEKLNLSEVSEASLDYLQPLIQRKKIQIESDIPADIFLNADKHMLFTIIRNLVSNAIKYCPQSGMVQISANELKNYVQFSVRDNGIGMSEDTMEKLFKQDKSFSTEGTYFEKGSGFGLIICKEFISTLGGEIHVTSDLGRGSIFTFTVSKNLR